MFHGLNMDPKKAIKNFGDVKSCFHCVICESYEHHLYLSEDGQEIINAAC